MEGSLGKGLDSGEYGLMEEELLIRAGESFPRGQAEPCYAWRIPGGRPRADNPRPHLELRGPIWILGPLWCPHRTRGCWWQWGYGSTC